MDQPALFDRYAQLLKEFISLRSISTDPKFSDDIQKTADWIKKLLEDNGFNVQLITGFDNPIVLAHYKNAESVENGGGERKKHVLIYGHYDVQPAAKEEGWTNDPFTLTEKDGRFLARGAVDNKGQIMIYLATVIELIKQKSLGYDVSFLIEGNEETGSGKFEEFIRTYKEELKADFLLVSDGEITAGHPALEVGFRGIVNIALTLETSKKDNHSGLYGGIMPNAATELALLLGKLFNENSMEERIAIKGFYDNVTEPTVDDIKANELIPFSDEDFKETSGAKTHFARNGWNIYTQLGFAPSLEITGIQSGYTGIGFRNSIPGSATVKMNLRLVHNQKPEDIAEKFKVFVEENLPEYCTYVLDATESCPPVHIPTEGPLFEKAIELMENIYGRTVIKKFCGATIPIAVLFEELLKIPQLYIPMANEDCNMHGADENFDIELVKKGLSFATKFLS
ncbi:MAG: M20/M25/M40 family metallo-hydrolase [Candidatus Pacebacteria bacterium]|nr:M20/M25/M40 family metallo-hydrolase [Candidatus Paceibacterota bacterium]